MRNLTHRCPQSRHFCPKLGHFFPIFKKGQGRPPPYPTLVTYQINYKQINMDCLSSSDVEIALDNIHKDFVVVPIDKATGNIVLVCEIFYASVITRELGLNNNSSTDTYNNAGALSANDIIDKNIRDLKIKFGIDNIPIENH